MAFLEGWALTGVSGLNAIRGNIPSPNYGLAEVSSLLSILGTVKLILYFTLEWLQETKGLWKRPYNT